MQLQSRRTSRNPGLGLAYVLLVVAIFVAVRLWPGGLTLLPVCPWRALTGFPCPFCEGTHAFVALAEGQIGLAWRANPLVALSVLAIFLWGLVDLVGMLTGKRPQVLLSAKEKKWLFALLGALLLANWLYLILSSRI